LAYKAFDRKRRLQGAQTDDQPASYQLCCERLADGRMDCSQIQTELPTADDYCGSAPAFVGDDLPSNRAAIGNLR
jgi:hypothetical protein